MNSFHSNNSSTLHPNLFSQNLWQQQESFYRVIHHQDQSSSRSQPNKSVTSYSQSELANNISCDQDSSVQISNGFLAGISFNSGKLLENQLGGHQEGFLNHQQKDNPKEDRQGKIENYKRKIQEKSQKSEWHFNAYRDAQYGLKQAYHDFHIYTNIELEISDLYNRWGFQLTKGHEYHEAIAQYSRAAGIRQNVVTQCNEWARWLHMNNHWPYAKEIGEKGKKSETELKDIYGNWAWALSRLKDYENAEVMYKEATKLDWKDTKVLRNWGYTLSLQGFYESALEKYEQVRDLDPRDGSVYINMGYCYMKLKIFDKSVTYYTNAIQLSPNDPKMKQEALYGWGKVLDDQGDYEEAVKKFEEAADIEEAGNKNTDRPAVKCLNRLGLLLYRLEKYEAALGLFTRLMNENPRYVFLSINTGLVYAQIEYRKGKQEIYFDSSKIQEIDFGEDYRKRAHENYNKAIDKFRNDAYLHSECISAFEREIKRNEERLKKDPNRDELRAVITEMTRVLQKVKDLEYFSLHSPNVSDSMIGNRQSEDSSVSERSYNLVDDSGRSDLDFEISTIQTLNSSIISDLDLHNWVKKLNSDEKIRHFPELLKIQQETSENWFKSFKKEKPGSESARKAYERYVKLKLGESKIRNRWGYELSVIQNYKEAIEEYERSAEIKLKIQRFDNKLIEFRDISNSQNGEKVDMQKQIRHDLSGVYKNWGYALTHLGRFDEAIMKYKEAIKCNRKNDGAYKEWGYTLSKQGKHEEAIEKSEEALKLRPNAERVLINMAHSFAMLGEFDQAETLCKDVLGEEGEVTVVKREAYYEWGNTLDEKGYLEGARDMFNAAALYVGESNVKSVNRLGLIDYYQRNYEAAQDKFNRIIMEDDQYGYAYINNGLVEAQIEAQKRSLPLDDVVNPNSADQAQMLNMPQKNLSFQYHLEIYHKAVDKEINRLKRDAAAYEVTINELNDLLGKLKTLKPSINENEEHKEDVDLKNRYYNEGIRIIKQKPYLQHDYKGVYENELKKAQRRLKDCRERMRQLTSYKMPYLI